MAESADVDAAPLASGPLAPSDGAGPHGSVAATSLLSAGAITAPEIALAFDHVTCDTPFE
jgi:hypothetical protein